MQDNGSRKLYPTGFIKEIDGKPYLTWLFETPGIELVPRELIERVAALMVLGARKYAPDNWRLGTSPEALQEYRNSLARHIIAWYRGDNDEDHGAAVIFNIIAHDVCLNSDLPTVILTDKRVLAPGSSDNNT